jgi:hypothetical protein
MNIAGIKNAATTGFASIVHLGKQYAPEILTGVGLVGGVGAAILGARATLKLEGILDEMNTELQLINARFEQGELADPEKAKARLYVKTALKIAKLYGPSVSLGVASIAAILSGHGMLRKRNAALVAAYGVLESAFENYRARVREEFGEDKDLEYWRGERQVTTGKGEKKEVAMVFDESLVVSPYARVFRSWTHPQGGSTQWDENLDYNIVFLNAQEQFANQRLQARGHLYLNEVYEALGFDHSDEGAVVGWIKGEGDDEVSFNIGDMANIRKGAMIDGAEGHIFLDFNVQGSILGKVNKKRR